MSGDRVCRSCHSPYGKRHKKGCPAYVEPTYSRAMIQSFMAEQKRVLTSPVNGEKQFILTESDLEQMEIKYFGEPA